MDQIPNTSSTIRSQLFKYQIIRIIHCNSDLGDDQGENLTLDLAQNFVNHIGDWSWGTVGILVDFSCTTAREHKPPQTQCVHV